MSEPGVVFAGLKRAVDEACSTIHKLRAVAEAARALVENTEDFGANSIVRDADLVTLDPRLMPPATG